MKHLFMAGILCGLALVGRAVTGVSKGEYLDLVEAAVGAYAPEHIRAYHARVQEEGRASSNTAPPGSPRTSACW